MNIIPYLCYKLTLLIRVNKLHNVVVLYLRTLIPLGRGSGNCHRLSSSKAPLDLFMRIM